MSQDVERQIRERAYQIWQEKGCPEGSDHEHWFLAEQEVATVPGAEPAPEKAAAKKAAPAAKKAPAKKAAESDTPKPAAKPRARKAAGTA